MADVKLSYTCVAIPIDVENRTLMYLNQADEAFIPFAFQTGYVAYFKGESQHDSPYRTWAYRRCYMTGWFEAARRYETDGETQANLLPLPGRQSGTEPASDPLEELWRARLESVRKSPVSTPDI